MRGILIAAILFALPAHACGPQSDCVIADRTYRIAMPEAHDGNTPVGAIVFAHGYRGSAAGLMRNQSLRKRVSDMGLAFIALKSKGDDWALPNAPRRLNETGASEFQYVEDVLTHAADQHPLDRNKLIMSGFSAGGMMVWNVACHRPGLFAGFAPIAGTFWLKAPENCVEPVGNIIHIHGDADPTVPMTGRRIADTHQGDVYKALAMYEELGRFKPSGNDKTDRLTCSEMKSPGNALLSLCMFKGGHSFRSEYLSYAWDRFRSLGAL